MSIGFDRRHLGRLAIGTVAALGLLGVLGTGAVAWGLPDADAYLNLARSLVHVLGAAASLLLVYYAVGARRRFAGGAIGEAATATAVGGAAFALAFGVMELNHGLGIDLLAGIGDMQLSMAIQMVLFTGTALAFGWGFARLAGALSGGSG